MEAITRKKATGWIFASIFTPLGITLLFSNIYIAFWYSKTGFQGPPPVDIMMKGIMTMTGPGLWATIFIWWLIHGKRSPFVELFATRSYSLVNDLLIGLGLGVLWIGIYGFSRTVSFGDMFEFNLPKFRSIPTSLSAGFCEEFLFRGFVFLLIARAGGGNKFQIIYSSLAFGMAHCTWGPWGMLWTVILGFTFGTVRLWRDNVWPTVAAHTILNLFIEPALIEKAMSGGFQ